MGNAILDYMYYNCKKVMTLRIRCKCTWYLVDQIMKCNNSITGIFKLLYFAIFDIEPWLFYNLLFSEMWFVCIIMFTIDSTLTIDTDPFVRDRQKSWIGKCLIYSVI